MKNQQSERDPEMMEARAADALAGMKGSLSYLNGEAFVKVRWRDMLACLAKFGNAEVRRALVEELGRLRVSTCSRILEETAMDRGVNVHVEHVTRIIDARLRELREDGSYYATAGVTGTGSELLKVRGETEQQPVVKAGQPMHVGTDRSMLAHFTAPRPGSSPRASDTAQTTAKDAGSIPLPGATLRERAERLLVCIPEPTFSKWAVDNAVALANDEADRAAQEMEAKMDEELRAVRDELSVVRESMEAWRFKAEQSEVAAGSRAPERVENAQADLPAPASSAPALSESEILERAADVWERHPELRWDAQAVQDLRGSAQELRAAPPTPAPDWIERMAGIVQKTAEVGQENTEDFLRARLEPVDARLEQLRGETAATWIQDEIKLVRSILRGEVTP